MSQFARRVAAAGAGALVLALAAGVPSASSDVSTNPTYVTDWVALTTGSTNTVKLVDPGTLAVEASQALNAGKACQLMTDNSVLSFAANPGSSGVGFSVGSIGVREKKNASGTSCAAVDRAYGESLTLGLTSASAPGTSVATSASLDIDLKQSAQIVATASLDGTVTGRFQLRSGASITAPADVGSVDATQDCNNPADSGPDSGINNNCRWNISAPSWTGPDDGIVFDTLELKSYVGSFSLMGGADGPVSGLPAYFDAYQNSSVLEIAEGALDCGETATLKGTVASSWKRLDNAGTDACNPFPYVTRTGQDANGYYAEFKKPLDVQTAAQALWTTTFYVGAGNTVPPISVSLERLNNTPLLFDPLEACGPSYYGTDGAFVAPTTPPPGPTACLVSAVRGTGGMKKYATYTAYVYGDATMRR